MPRAAFTIVVVVRTSSGVDCCCANCVVQFQTWGNSLRYAGVRTRGAELSSLLAAQDFGDGPGAEALENAARAYAAAQGAKRRAELISALGLFPEGDANFFIRCCCAPCVQCQETDTVFVFYRDSLGYRDLHYGSWTRCACTRWYTFEPATIQTAPGVTFDTGGRERLVPFPWDNRGQSAGPNYTVPSDTGWFFVAGRPKPIPAELALPGAPSAQTINRGSTVVK